MAEFIKQSSSLKQEKWDVVGLNGGICGVVEYHHKMGVFGFTPKIGEWQTISEGTLGDILEVVQDLNNLYFGPPEDESAVSQANTESAAGYAVETTQAPASPHNHCYLPIGQATATNKDTVILSCTCGDVIKVKPRDVQV